MARLVGDDEAEHTGRELFWLPPPRSQIPDPRSQHSFDVLGGGEVELGEGAGSHFEL